MRNDRWSTLAEIRRTLTPDTDKTQGGLILYRRNGRCLKYTGEENSIILGITGTGKSRCCTINMTNDFVDTGESFVALDPKGELHAYTAWRLGKQYRKIVIDFRHVGRSACYNPLAMPAELYRSGDPEKKDLAMEMIDDLAYKLFPTTEDPFWPLEARDVFCAAACILMERADEDEINMTSLYRLISDSDSGGFSGCQMLRDLIATFSCDSLASVLMSCYLSVPLETRNCIRGVFLQGLSKFVKNEGLISMTASDDLCINQLDGQTPTAIYIILPDETPIYNSICTVLVGQLMTHYIRLAQDRYGGRLPRRINFLVEEAGNIGRIAPLSHLMSAGRSRNVRIHLVLQNYSQLNTLYGDAEANTIRNNAGVLVAFRGDHWNTLVELSDKCGERNVECCGHLVREKLITPSQLAAMKTGMALVRIAGKTCFITRLPDCSELSARAVFDSPSQSASPRRPVKIFRMKDHLPDTAEPDAEHPLRVMRRRPPAVEPAGGSESLRQGLNLEALLKEVNQKMEKAVEQQDRDTQEAAERYRITLQSCDGPQRNMVRAIMRHTDLTTLFEARSALEHLPHTFAFTSRESAEEARQAMLQAGGAVTDVTGGPVGEDEICILVTNTGDRLPATVKVIQNISGMTCAQVLRELRNLPLVLTFKDADTARTAAAQLKDAGVKFIARNFEE